MKKFLVVAIFILLPSLASAAKYGSAGCGPGSMIFEGDQTWWKQVLASTSNTWVVQGTAIAMGTSNCDSPAPLKVGQAQAYVEANKVALANDIARGNGETIVGLSKVYGCANSTEFGQALKANYAAIFASADSASREITHNINTVAATTCNTKI
ncbi:MAG: DUF3015 family protein [Bacteriovoracia bacterium]